MGVNGRVCVPYIISMHNLLAWDNYLGELADVANNCGQKIVESH
jgi:hypothetical protein